MALEKSDLEYFERGKYENPRFFDLIGGEPSFHGLRVLDIGCGHGSLCIYIALQGADCVVGVDMDPDRIKFAQENLAQNFPQLIGKCEFRCCDSAGLTESGFDIITSKDTLEHIIDLECCIADVKSKLAVGGRFFAGFGPLYYSPFGDHRRLKAGFPWGHVVLSEKKLLKQLRDQYGSKAESVFDLGLNKLRVRDYEKFIADSGLHLVSYKTNSSRSIISKLFKLIANIRPLQDYFSHNMYFILERKD
ncbi:MAG: methyltransferase domain-containing protein [Armatimonadetes bacterium]|nr:methyltransferase domain-containing protein [Armatimonadota bacterium]